MGSFIETKPKTEIYKNKITQDRTIEEIIV